MELKVVYSLFIFLYGLSFCKGAFVIPLIPSITGAIGGLAGLAYMALPCFVGECCNEKSIPGHFSELENDLHRHLFGQPLVINTIIHALRSHWDPKHKPQKALTLSFHGWPGSGKNYVAKYITDHLYKAGSKSRFVHNFIGRIQFPRNDKTQEYQRELYTWIKGNTTLCPKQLFIFDEVDKMPPLVLDAIKPMIDYRDNVEGIDYRETIFIFLSNTGATLINDEYQKLWNTLGKKREDLTMHDFENLITLGSFNEEGGFHHSDTIRSNLIDHYVPFLPMEREHVKMCIKNEFKNRGVSNPNEEHIQEAMDFIQWGPDDLQLFSKTGCKRISQKVGALVYKHKQK